MKDKTIYYLGIVILVFLLFPFLGRAQTLDFENKVSIILDDGTTVTMHGKAKTLSSDFTGEYYYLPTNLRLSHKKDDPTTPEFLFLKYTTEDREDQGGVSGALLHFLMEWGLTVEQEAECQKKLTKKIRGLAATSQKFRSVRNPKLMGAATLLNDTEDSFRIISGTLSSKKFTPSMMTTGRASTFPGGKVAVASLLEKNGAQLLAATFEKNRSISDVSVSLRFDYKVMAPAINGRITVDWEKAYTFFQNRTKDNINKGPRYGKNRSRPGNISETMLDSLKETLTENNIVKIELDVQEADNPVAQEVVKMFMEMFMSSISEKQFATMENAKPIEDSKEPSRYVYEYHLDQTKFESKVQKKKEVYELTARFPLRQTITITENLASWYDGVKHNKKCVSTVNLNDPFFQHRDVKFIVDAEVEDSFNEKEINYVTVTVKKERNKGGNDFMEDVTISPTSLKEKGNLESLTYSKGKTDDASAYKYRTQWSLRGGHIFNYPEAEGEWITGSWQAVTLSPPASTRIIEFEADLAELEAADIKRATLQLRYKKFGKEFTTNIKMTVSKGVPLVEKTIFMDRDQQGYAYRLILTHKTKGKLVYPPNKWKTKINDDYVYASIPEKLAEKDESFIDKLKKAADAVSTADGVVSDVDSVLDKFKGVLDKFSE